MDADPKNTPKVKKMSVKNETTSKSDAAKSKQAKKSQPKSAAVKKADKPKVTKSTTAKASTAAKTTVIERGWEIRIGTFAKQENAARVAAMLRKEGFKPNQLKVKMSKGTVIRVWVGPFATRVTAGRTQATIEAKTKQKGWIAPYP